MEDLKRANIIHVLESQVELLIEIKQELIRMNDYSNVATFRDYEKKIEKAIDSLKEINVKEGQIRCDEVVESISFSYETKKIFLMTIENSESITYTKDVAWAIIVNADKALKEILKASGEDFETLNTVLLDIENYDVESAQPKVSRHLLKAIDTSFLELKLLKGDVVTPNILLLSILRNENDNTTKTLNRLGLNYRNFKKRAFI